MRTKSFSEKAFTACFLFSIVIFELSSCSWDQTYLFGNGGDGVKDSICFQNEIFPIINSNCAKSGCHDATTQAAGYDLSNYFGVMTIVKPGNPGKSRLMTAINGGGEEMMPPPPDPSLTTDQIDLIQRWIVEGAGYNIDCGVATLCDTTNITYAGTIEPIIQNNCLGCHAASGTGGGILLTTWGQVANQALYGNLLCSIYQEAGCHPMPKNGAQLSPCDLTKISMWVDAGAPNN
jgi:uncharacterized membrane protein